MISGIRIGNFRVALGLLVSCMASQAHAVFTLDRLLDGFSRISSSQAEFTERLHLAVLESPLLTEGRLDYRRPDYLEKQVLTPEPSRFLVDGERLLVETADRQHVLALDSQPAVQAFVEAYRGTLSGNRRSLEQYYRLHLSGDQEDWTLRLEPSQPQLAQRIQYIVISGHFDQIHRIEIRETSGDYSQMDIRPDAD